MSTYKIAKTVTEIEAVIALVAKVYAKSGYVSDDESLSGITNFLYDQDRSLSIQAFSDGVFSGTISVVCDGERGLPMDSLYEAELAPLREQGQVIAEVCQFAIDKTVFAGGATKLTAFAETDLALQLFALVISYCERKQINQAVFAVNPKHRLFYEAIGAKRIGEEKPYQSVSDAPAIAYALDLELLRQSTRGLFILRTVKKLQGVAEELFATLKQ